MNRFSHALRFGSTMALAGLMAACGNDGNEKTASTTTAATLTGTVAIGAPVSGATINAKCIVGNYSATSNASGTYGLVIPAGNFPCAVRSSGGTANGNPAPTLHSFARNTGTANVTPLTDLALALKVNATASQSITDWFANPGNLLAISTALADAADDLRDALIAAGYSVPATWTAGSSAPFSSTFTPNPATDAYDQLLEAIAEAIENSATLTDYNALLTAFVTNSTLPNPPANTSLSDPTGTGSALNGDYGITGTINGITYTYTTLEVKSAGSNPFGIINARGNGTTTGSSAIWQILGGIGANATGIPTSPGLYNCSDEITGLRIVASTVADSINADTNAGSSTPVGAGECRLEIISVSATQIEGRFHAELVNDLSYGGQTFDVTDGYFRACISGCAPAGGSGTIPGNGVAATVNSGLVGNYNLKFSAFNGGCGALCNYVDGQSYSANIGSDGSLTINGNTITNPFTKSGNTAEVHWLIGNLLYSVSNQTSGSFNEINISKNDNSTFLGQFTKVSTPATPLAAIQALAGSYEYETQATGTAVGDLGLINRGLRIDTDYPACTALGQSNSSQRWKAKIVIGSNGSVSVQNPGNASQAITLTPGSVSTNDNTTVALYPYSTMWSMANPGSKVYEIKRAIRYDDGIHPTPLTEYFSIQLGITSNGELGNVGLQGVANSPRLAFCPVSSMVPEPVDRLAPLKALAGSYNIGHDYLTDSPSWVTPGWSQVTIASNGSVTFGGSAPSFSPSEIADLRINRRNENNNGADNSIWALTALINRDINGDSVINIADRINFFLNEAGELRDIQYKDSATHLVEVSALTRQLPAYDETLSASLSGNGIVGKIDGVSLPIAGTETFTKIEVYNSGRVDFYAGRNKFPDVPAAERRAWRITVNTTNLQLNTPYPCTNGNLGSIYQGSAVLFDNGFGILTGAGSGFAVQPSHNSRAGGDCEITLSSVSKNASGILTGVEGKFRATLWVGTEKRYVPAAGFFRLAAP